jgi:hypothetical protein
MCLKPKRILNQTEKTSHGFLVPWDLDSALIASSSTDKNHLTAGYIHNIINAFLFLFNLRKSGDDSFGKIMSSKSHYLRRRCA